MKRIILTIIILFTGMALAMPSISAQDLSFYIDDYMRRDGTFAHRLLVLENLHEDGITGTGEFYHSALRYLLDRAPDIRGRNEQEAAEKTVIILCQALGAAKYAEAAADIYAAAEFFDIVQEGVREPNEGHAMQAAIIALADIDARFYIPHIVQRLTDFNTQLFKNAEVRRKVQAGVIGCIRALETFKDISGYRPVFFAYIPTSSWDPMVKQIAGSALPNITDDPADVMIDIIRDTSIIPPIKLEAWREMLRTNAPEESKARVAVTALNISWMYQTSNRSQIANLKEMRKGAVDIIRQYGAEGDNLYIDLEKTYSSNFISNTPDNDEIIGSLAALSALKTEEAGNLLYKFLSELNTRRRTGPWRNKERQVFEWVVTYIGASETKNPNIRVMLRLISRSEDYTAYEQSLARNALSSLGN